MRRASLAAVLLLLASCNQPSLADRLVSAKWVDLTYPFDSATVYWPTAQPFHLTVVSAKRMPGGWYYAANNFSAAEDGGTHVDAPIHFVEKKRTTDEIPLSQLIAPAVVIDVRHQADSSADYRVHQSDITGWEAEHGQIREGDIVFVRTGWGTRWPDRARYLGTTKAGTAGVAELHFPGLDLDAARLLVRRRVSAVGIDTPSVDYGQSRTYQVHRRLFASNVPAFENVANLDQLPLTGAFVVALPMKIRGGAGGPLRIVALLP
ncbi:MAG TPA: cyclase family protein [Gemmatimonadales bacterium]|nr:cyclase family protein [Gemmatimonadales bacterium]